jgi:hypothetical protein
MLAVAPHEQIILILVAMPQVCLLYILVFLARLADKVRVKKRNQIVVGDDTITVISIRPVISQEEDQLSCSSCR